MYRIGIVNIDTSHPKAFSGILARQDKARYSAIFNSGFRGDDEVGAFMRANGIERRSESIAQMADEVDIGFIQSCNWEDHIREAMPFLERGKPVFIDKPICGNLRDCRKLEELAAGGARIFGSSSLRYAAEIERFWAQPEEKRGVPLSLYSSAGVDEFNYAIHSVEGMDAIARAPAESVRHISRAEIDEVVCDTYRVVYVNGVDGVYKTVSGPWMSFELVALTTRGAHDLHIRTTDLYVNLLDRIVASLESGVDQTATVPELTQSVRIMLAGRQSRLDGSREVRLSELDERDPGFDGAAFAAGYAAAARKIYE